MTFTDEPSIFVSRPLRHADRERRRLCRRRRPRPERLPRTPSSSTADPSGATACGWRLPHEEIYLGRSLGELGAPRSRTWRRMTVTICDVGPRDGLQNQVGYARAGGARGAARQAHGRRRAPRSRPSASSARSTCRRWPGAEEVVAAIERRKGAVYAGLAVNERGYDSAARERGSTRSHFAFAATEEFNRRNAGASVDEAVAAAQSGSSSARRPTASASTVTISVAFGCPFEGARRPRRASWSSPRGSRAPGPDEIALADTIGVGVPRQVRDLVPARIARPASRSECHLHNTRNTRFRGRVAALEAGVSVLDASRRRDRRLPVRTAGDGQHRDRGPRLPPPRRRRRDGHRPRRVDRRGAVARIMPRARARGSGLQSRHVCSGRRLGGSRGRGRGSHATPAGRSPRGPERPRSARGPRGARPLRPATAPRRPAPP